MNYEGVHSHDNVPPQVNIKDPQQGRAAQTNNQTSNLMGQARELLYGPVGYMSLNDGCPPPGVLQSQQPQQSPFLYQTPPLPPQVQNSHYSQLGVSSMPIGNQHNSPVLSTFVHNTSMNSNGTNDQTIPGAPQWASMLMKTKDTWLQNIKTQISSQKACKAKIAEWLILNFSYAKRSVGRVQLQVSDVDERVKNV